MVQLKRLILKNFKSFRRADIPFKNGFTAIVGPNGSGKSNIVDALIFVLGSTSSKKMRAERLSDLIFENAKEGYAKVEAVFSGKGKTWKVTRIIDKNGKSIYRLNGERKTLGEIRTLLTELGVLCSHNIVLQGDVTRVIEMNAIERRRIIDELVGIEEFEEKKAEAEKELNKVEERLKEARILLKEREAYLRQLEEERRAAERYEALSEEKQRLHFTMLMLQHQEMLDSLKQISEKANKKQKEKKLLEEKLATHQEKVEALVKKSQELAQQVLESHEREIQALIKQVEERNADLRVVEERIRSKNELVASNEARINYLSQELEALSQTEAQLKQELNSLNEDRMRVEQSLAELQQQDIQQQQRPFLENLEALRKRSAELTEEKQHLFEKRAALQAKLDELYSKNKELEEELHVLERTIKELQHYIATHSKAESQFEKLMAEKPDNELKIIRKSIMDKTAELQVTKERIDVLRNMLKAFSASTATCPVCDTKLSKQRSRTLVEKKRSEFESLITHLEMLQSELKKLKEDEETLAKKSEELSRLGGVVASLREKRARMKELKAREAKLKSSRVSDAVLKKELAALDTRLSKLSDSLNKTLREITMQESALEQLETEHEEEKLALRSQLDNIKHRTELNNRKLDDIVARKQHILEEINSLKESNVSLKKEIGELETKAEKLRKEIATLERKQESKRYAVKDKLEEQQRIRERISKLEEHIRDTERKLRKIEAEQRSLLLEENTFNVKLADLEEEMKGINVKPFKHLNKQECKRRLAAVERELESLGAVNLRATQDYDSFTEELLKVRDKVQKLEQEMMAVRDMMDKIELKRKQAFMECFNQVKQNFENMFRNFFNGEGSLTLTDEENVAESGLVIKAKHRGRKLKSLDMLSGGEKALTALVFLFAVQLYRPAPFYIFDEADASLDEENSLKFSKVVKQLSEYSQFIAITHNPTLVKSADQLIGVARGADNSSVIGLDLKELVVKRIREKGVVEF
jgi:chromosome segregation protein